MMCGNACIFTVSSMHAFSAIYDQAFPCPIYTQSRACWVWARCTNDGKLSQHRSYRLRSLTSRTPSPKCLMHMLTLLFSESMYLFKWNFANTVEVCHTHLLKCQLCPLIWYLSIFLSFHKCFIYGIMLSHLKAFFYRTIYKKKPINFNWVCIKQDISRCYFLDRRLDRDLKPSLLTTKRQLMYLTVFTNPLMTLGRMKIFQGISF